MNVDFTHREFALHSLDGLENCTIIVTQSQIDALRDYQKLELMYMCRYRDLNLKVVEG